MPGASAIVSLSLFGWIPVVILLFTVLRPTRAVIVAFVGAWLFLPQAGFAIPGPVPNYDKVSATCLGVFLAAMLFDSQRLARFRLRWFDAPMLLWIGVGFVSSFLGGWGPYEATSAIMHQGIMWGLPYFIGRLYLGSVEALHDLAVALVVGGLLYVPFCLYEIRMSPQLHAMVYGFHQNDWLQTRRGGGWRPTVFMEHGLAVGAYMCAAALLAVWLWLSRAARSVMGVPIALAAVVLLGTAVACKSTGASILMVGGLGVLLAARLTRSVWPIWIMAAAPLLYIMARTLGGWRGTELVDLARLVSAERAASLQCRLNSETGLWRVVQPRLFLGAGRFIWAGIVPEGTSDRIIPDGMWIIALGRFGLVGLAAFVGIMGLPILGFVRRFQGRAWSSPGASMAGAWSVVIAIYLIDSLTNAMLNPIFLLAAGGLIGAMPPEAPAPRRVEPEPGRIRPPARRGFFGPRRPDAPPERGEARA